MNRNKIKINEVVVLGLYIDVRGFYKPVFEDSSLNDKLTIEEKHKIVDEYRKANPKWTRKKLIKVNDPDRDYKSVGVNKYVLKKDVDNMEQKEFDYNYEVDQELYYDDLVEMANEMAEESRMEKIRIMEEIELQESKCYLQSPKEVIDLDKEIMGELIKAERLEDERKLNKYLAFPEIDEVEVFDEESKVTISENFDLWCEYRAWDLSADIQEIEVFDKKMKDLNIGNDTTNRIREHILKLYSTRDKNRNSEIFKNGTFLTKYNTNLVSKILHSYYDCIVDSYCYKAFEDSSFIKVEFDNADCDDQGKIIQLGKIVADEIGINHGANLYVQICNTYIHHKGFVYLFYRFESWK